MKLNKLTSLLIMLCAFIVMARAQNTPPPCSTESIIQTTCYNAAAGGCAPCYYQYCVDTDVYYGTTCNAYCSQPVPACDPAAIDIVQSTTCRPGYPNPCSDPGQSFDCITTFYRTSVCDPSANCGSFTTEFCSASPSSLLKKEKNRAKTLLAHLRALHLVQGS